MNVLRRLWQGSTLARGVLAVLLRGPVRLHVPVRNPCFRRLGNLPQLGIRRAADCACARTCAALRYLLFATVGIWRSAGPDLASPIWLSRIWAGVARFVVAAWVAMIAFRLPDGGALRVLQWIMGDLDS